jgi:electron transfer flavoprotein beta subunit
VVNGAGTVEVSREGGTADVATARVTGPDGVETYAVPLPAVVTVLEGGVEPRYPTISGRMKAKKVKIETVAPQREPAGSGRVRLLLPPAQPSAVEVLGEGPDAAKAVVDLLEKLGVAR